MLGDQLDAGFTHGDGREKDLSLNAESAGRKPGSSPVTTPCLYRGPPNPGGGPPNPGGAPPRPIIPGGGPPENPGGGPPNPGGIPGGGPPRPIPGGIPGGAPPNPGGGPPRPAGAPPLGAIISDDGPPSPRAGPVSPAGAEDIDAGVTPRPAARPTPGPAVGATLVRLSSFGGGPSTDSATTFSPLKIISPSGRLRVRRRQIKVMVSCTPQQVFW